MPAWTIPWPPLASNALNSLSYDTYSQGLEGGPLIDYWWKMQENYTSTGVGEANYGAAGVMPLYAEGTVTSLSSQQAGICLRTSDSYAVTKGNAGNTHRAGVLVDGTDPFTTGGWFRLSSSTDCGIFKSNTGGQQGWAHGIHIRVANDGKSLGIRTGSGSSASQYTWATASGTFSYNTTRFVVLYVEPASTTGALVFKLYVDGAQITSFAASGSSGAIAWPVTNTSGVAPGIAFNRGDGQTNGSVAGEYDELFFHWGELTAAQIAEMYRRGSTPL